MGPSVSPCRLAERAVIEDQERGARAPEPATASPVHLNYSVVTAVVAVVAKAISHRGNSMLTHCPWNHSSYPCFDTYKTTGAETTAET
jgi:hypothetical protein